MTILEQHLGRCLSAREVSEYLRCDIATVYRHFRQLGGVKVGVCYKFFEKRLANALLECEAQEVDSASDRQRRETQQPARQQIRRAALGSRHEKGAGRRQPGDAPCDPHGLLA
ncbi:hypothetical protein [Candidatus Electronema sp. JM]|uniref:hypothetical protein n=1 Tax=Candidatus Electronema sp. JM TaxID=3401571 RepID=UPI003AA7F06E